MTLWTNKIPTENIVLFIKFIEAITQTQTNLSLVLSLYSGAGSCNLNLALHFKIQTVFSNLLIHLAVIDTSIANSVEKMSNKSFKIFLSMVLRIFQFMYFVLYFFHANCLEKSFAEKVVHTSAFRIVFNYIYIYIYLAS